MKLYLVRHGEAELGTEDPGLSVRGREQAKKSAAFVSGTGVRSLQIFHSRKRRAKETAEEFARVISPRGGLVEKDGISPNDDPAEWADIVERETDDLMLVGHMPFMPALANLLLTGDTDKGIIMGFENAAVLSLVRNGGACWVLEWFVSPKLI